jgi:two-component system chemotaxis response regulator CheY
MRVLIVDDSRAVRAILARALAELGFADQAEAADGRQALAAIASRGPFDLAMVDWNMPVMDGLAFVEEARRTIPSERMRIVMCTTETEADQIAKALTAGADEYIMKPFTADALRSKLELLGLLAG